MATLKIEISGNVDIHIDGGPTLENVPVSMSARSVHSLESLFARGRLEVGDEGLVRIRMHPTRQMLITISADVVAEIMAQEALDEMRMT